MKNDVLRQTLLDNGYTPLPNVGKACFMEGWPRVVVTAETIQGWEKLRRFKDTGLRVENGLAVLDLDINDGVMNAVASALEEAEPDLARALVRFGKGHKEAWFLRTDEPFGRLHSRRWIAPGASADSADVAAVECFGGASPRQFGAFGAHTREPNGEVKIAYEWARGPDDQELSPLTVPLDQLPIFSKGQLARMIDVVERVLEREGWAPVLRSSTGENEAVRAFDLTDDMRFDCNDDVTRTLEELKQHTGEGLRCSASWLEDGAVNRTRCIVGRSRSGAVTIYETASGVTHLPASEAPVAHEARQLDAALVAKRLQRLAEAEEHKKTMRRLQLNAEDNLQQATGKLLQTYAFCAHQHQNVVPLWATSVTDGMTLTNFRTLMLPWCEVDIGPRGGERKINPVDVWSASAQRIAVAGLMLRPDMGRPTFKEAGKTYVNTYTPIEHPLEGGDHRVGLEFMEQLLPDESERLWFTRWLAYKYRNPGIPGPAIVMVARAHGTGRGTLGELVRRLFGPRYVRSLPFDHFAGKTYQSQYTEWQADSLVVVVNESSDTAAGGYASKRDTYERLKDIVDPRPLVRHIILKGEKAIDVPSFTSYLVFTNHVDALPLPADDRRFAVLRNGEPREPEFWERVNAWMEDPLNVAAFARWLEELELGDYSPFAMPPKTELKQAMSDLAASDVDRGFDLALANLTGELLIIEQIVNSMRQAVSEYGFEYPDRWQQIVKRMMSSRLERIGIPHGANWTPMVDGKRYAVYARDRRTAGRWTSETSDNVRRELLRNGSPAESTLTGNIARANFKAPGSTSEVKK